MPQQRKRKSAEEILGIAPRPRRSAEEILGIPQGQTAEDRRRIWAQEQEGAAEERRRIWQQERQQRPLTVEEALQRPASGPVTVDQALQRPVIAQQQPPPAPTQDTNSLLQNAWEAAKNAGRNYIEKPIITLGEAIESAQNGDWAPLKNIAEATGRGALKVVDSISAAQTANPETAEIQTPAIQQLARERVQGSKTLQDIQGRNVQYDAFTGRNPSKVAKVVRGATGVVTGALPVVATGLVTGGSVPAMAGVTALQSMGEPETLPLNVGLSAIPAPAVAPILRRIRGSRGAGSAIEAALGPEAQAVSRGVTVGPAAERQAINSPLGVRVGPAVEEASIRAERGLPALEADYGVSTPTLGVRGAPGASIRTGPAAETAAFDVGADPSLVTKTERTPVLEVISAARKAGLLTGAKTHLKNVGGTGLFQLSEEVSRIPAAIVDALISPITKRRTLIGPSPTAMLHSFEEAATKGWAEAREIWRKGVSDADLERLGLNKEINSGSKILDTYVNRTFRLLGAEDKLFGTYATRRALEDRAKAAALTEMRQGKIPRGDVGKRTRELLDAPPEDLAAAAIADAEVAVFTNSNIVSRFSEAGKRAIQGVPGGRGATFLLDQVFPFTKTPTNVIARMLEYTPAGGAYGGIRAVRAALKGTFTDAEQRAFSQTFGRASIGSGLLMLGAKLYWDGKMTGLIEDDPTRRARDEAAGRTPGSIKIGDNWFQLLGAAPLGSLLAIGATLARETQQEGEDAGFLPAVEVAAQAIGEQPLLIGSKQIAESLTRPGSTGERLLGGLVGSYVPTMVSDVAEAIDPTARETRGQGVLGYAQKRVPFLRQSLPEAQDVLGRGRQDFGPVQAMIDPTRATTDVTQQHPLFRELVRLDAGVSRLTRRPGETDDAYRSKAQSFGDLYERFGLGLIGSRAYQSASDELRLAALADLNETAKRLILDGKERTALSRLNPNIVIGAARAALRRQQGKAKVQARR